MLVLCSLAFAQQAPVPPPEPPGEPATTYRLEVQVLRGGQPVQGVSALLYKLGPGGRPLPINIRPAVRVSGPDGRLSWAELSGRGLMLQLRDPRTGFSLTVPLLAEYMAPASNVGPYQIRLEMRP